MSPRSRVSARASLSLLTVMALAAACGHGNDPPTTAAIASPPPAAPTATTSLSPQPSTTPAPPTPAATLPPTRAITGLFTDPRPRPPARQALLSPTPPSPFQPWNQRDVVLYDRATMTEVNLGEGESASFSPDGRYLAWGSTVQLSALRSAPGPIWMLDLATNAKRVIADGLYFRRWKDGESIEVQPPTGATVRLNVITGDQAPAPAEQPQKSRPIGRWVLESFTYPNISLLYDSTGILDPLQLETNAFSMAEDGSLLLVIADRNVFEVDPITARARFLVTTDSDPRLVPRLSTQGVVWHEGACTPSAKTLVYERSSGRLTEFTPWHPFVRFAAERTVGLGRLPSALFNLDTLAYDFVLPPEAGLTTAWSSDYQRAVVSNGAFGSDGPCM